MKCPKCGGEMEEGLFTTFRGFSWTMTKDRDVLDKLSNPLQTNVNVYRCKSCGYLESYAK